VYIGHVHNFVMYVCIWVALACGYGVQSSSECIYICMCVRLYVMYI